MAADFFYEIFVLISILEILMNFSAKNPLHCKAMS